MSSNRFTFKTLGVVHNRFHAKITHFLERWILLCHGFQQSFYKKFGKISDLLTYSDWTHF